MRHLTDSVFVRTLSCHVQIFIIFFIFCDSLRSSGEHFWEYRQRFCAKRRVPVGIDFLGGLNFKIKNFLLLNPQNMNFRPLFRPKTLHNGAAHT